MLCAMKSDSTSSGDTSMDIERCSLKLRFFILVVNTADLINERTTLSPWISHAVISPVSIFSTYLFIGVLVIGELRQKFASYFLQIYAILACSALEMYLAITVFRELKANPGIKDAALFLNGILPMTIIFTLVVDLVVILFANRDINRPVLPQSSPQTSQLNIPI